MTVLVRWVAVAFVVCVAGCATDGFTVPTADVTFTRMNAVRPDRMNAVAIGRSTKGDVVAALGETLVIRFDTGYEVWAYRLENTRSGEFVILFAPSGVVTKTRIRG